MRVGTSHREANVLGNTADVLYYFVVPEPKDSVACFSQRCSSGLFFCAVQAMVTAIYFDDDAALGAAEVGYEPADEVLTTELDAF